MRVLRVRSSDARVVAVLENSGKIAGAYAAGPVGSTGGGGGSGSGKGGAGGGRGGQVVVLPPSVASAAVGVVRLDAAAACPPWV